MPSLEVLVSFATAALIMNLSPGPSNLYVMARTMAQGVGGGLAAVAGLAIGSLLHVAATVLGLAALLNYSPLAYALLKTAGALYLVYLGLGYLFSNPSEENRQVKTAVKSNWKIFQESVIVEATNPKTALFFLALLPQFVNAGAGSVSLQLLILGLIVTVSAIPCDLLVTFSAHRVSRWMKSHPDAQRLQNRVSGSVLTGLGVYVLASDSR